MCIHNHQAAQIWIKFITQIFSCKLCKSTLNECRHRNRNVDIETNFYWATSNKRCYITIKRNTSISWWSPAYLWCNTVNTHINTHILWINMYIIYIYIYVYIYIYIHGVITTEGFFEVAIESLPEWDLNPWPLNSVQIYPISSLPLSFQMFDSSDYFKNVEISKGHSISYSKETKYKKKIIALF